MKHHNISKQWFLLFIPLILFSLTACDKQSETLETKKMVSAAAELEIPIDKDKPQNDKIIIENKSYLFDVANHSIEELQALLTRAEEISQEKFTEFDDLKIVMVIHGPDIEWFTRQNYDRNRQLIDLAARLDTYDIIDMKVCEKTMSLRDIERKDIPAFIESVPYAPTEIRRRLQDDYINL